MALFRCGTSAGSGAVKLFNTPTLLNTNNQVVTVPDSSGYDYLVLLFEAPGTQGTDLHYSCVVDSTGELSYGLVGISGARSYQITRSGNDLTFVNANAATYTSTLTGVLGTDDSDIAGML